MLCQRLTATTTKLLLWSTAMDDYSIDSIECSHDTINPRTVHRRQSVQTSQTRDESYCLYPFCHPHAAGTVLGGCNRHPACQVINNKHKHNGWSYQHRAQCTSKYCSGKKDCMAAPNKAILSCTSCAGFHAKQSMIQKDLPYTVQQRNSTFWNPNTSWKHMFV